jgi:DHA2 family multidrug resistance protein-like MFS transporter
MSETATEFGLALGVALIGSVGVGVYRSNMAESVPDGLPPEAAEAAAETLPGAVAVAEQLPPEQAARLVERAFGVFVDGLHATAVVCGIAVLVLAAVSFGLLRNTRTSAQADSTAEGEPAVARTE